MCGGCVMGRKAQEYNDGYDAGNDGEPFDARKSDEWKEGWRDAWDDKNLHEDFW